MRLCRGGWGRAGMAALLGVVLTAQCGCLGPMGVRVTRSRYNEAIQTTNNEELLLNLVRLRYNESPGFLPITGLNAQFELSATAEFTGGKDRGDPTRLGVGSLGFADRPTLSFAPQRPPELTKALLVHINLDTLYLFARQGWDLDRLMRLMVRNINGVENAGNAGGPPPLRAPEYAAFRTLAGLFDRLQREHGLVITSEKRLADVPNAVPVDAVGAPDLLAIQRAGLGVRPRGADKGYVLTQTESVRVVRLAPWAVQSPEFLEIARILRLQAASETYDLDEAPEGQLRPGEALAAGNKVTVTTRSILEVMSLMSQAVCVPEDHVRAGVATVTLNPDGTRFDWGEVLGGVFHVCVSKMKPHGAWTAVHYRGYWYYIEDADVSSKNTISLFNELFRLQRIGAAEGQPVLTLPVGK